MLETESLPVQLAGDQATFPHAAILLSLPFLITPAAGDGCNLADVAAGSAHSLALDPSAAVWAWGSNTNGEVGESPEPERLTPGPNGVLGVLQVAAGRESSYALTADGRLLAWGGNLYGELGDGSNDDSGAPVEVLGLVGVVAVAAGGYHALALTADGAIWAWGDGASGQLGDGRRRDSNLPVAVSLGVRAVAIAAGLEHSLAADEAGAVWAWGANDLGQLGDGRGAAGVRSDSPVLVPGLSDIADVAAGAFHSLALGGDGQVRGWGFNGRGALGDGTGALARAPVLVDGLERIAAISAGAHHSLALGEDGRVFAWGRNRRGALGDGTLLDAPRPLVLDGLGGPAVKIAAGEWHTLALVGGGALRGIGANDSGQLGDGTRLDASAPVGAGTEPTPPDQGNVLRAARSGEGVQLEFTGAPASRWRVYRDGDRTAIGRTALLPDAGEDRFLDPGALARAGNDFYYLRGLSPCSLTPGL